MLYSQTRASLLQAIKAGDEISWEVFYARYRPLAEVVGRQYRLPPGDLDEFVQDVMTDFFTAQRKFNYDPSKGRFRDYFLRIVRNRLFARFRAQKRREAHFGELPEDVDAADLPDTRESELESIWDREWRSHVLREAMQAVQQSPDISPRALQVFDLFEAQKVAPKEIAKLLGISQATVYNDRNAVLEALREAVKSLGEGPAAPCGGPAR